jgi:hypothetical protein
MPSVMRVLAGLEIGADGREQQPETTMIDAFSTEPRASTIASRDRAPSARSTRRAEQQRELVSGAPIAAMTASRRCRRRTTDRRDAERDAGRPCFAIWCRRARSPPR